MISARFPARPIHFTKCHHRETIKKLPALSARSFFSEIIYHFSQGHTGIHALRVTSQMPPDFRAFSFVNRERTTFIASTCLLNRPCGHSPHLASASAAVITFSRLLFTVLFLLVRTITELTIKRTASPTKTGSSFHVAMVTQERFELPTP